MIPPDPPRPLIGYRAIGPGFNATTAYTRDRYTMQPYRLPGTPMVDLGPAYELIYICPHCMTAFFAPVGAQPAYCACGFWHNDTDAALPTPDPARPEAADG